MPRCSQSIDVGARTDYIKTHTHTHTHTHTEVEDANIVCFEPPLGIWMGHSGDIPRGTLELGTPGTLGWTLWEHSPEIFLKILFKVNPPEILSRILWRILGERRDLGQEKIWSTTSSPTRKGE